MARAVSWGMATFCSTKYIAHGVGFISDSGMRARTGSPRPAWCVVADIGPFGTRRRGCEGRVSVSRFVQFADFVEPLLPDLDADADVEAEALSRTAASVTKVLRRRWFVNGAAPPAETMLDMPPHVVRRLLGAEGRRMSVGATSRWGPRTSQSTARNVGGALHLCTDVDELVLGAACGATALEAMQAPGGMAPTTLVLCNRILDHAPRVSKLSSVRNVRVECFSTDASQHHMAYFLRELSRLSALETLDIRELSVLPPPEQSRRVGLGASSRDSCAAQWRAFEQLARVHSLRISFDELDHRCGQGLLLGVYRMPALRSLALICRGGAWLDADYGKLSRLTSLEVVADRAFGLGALQSLERLSLTSLAAPKGFPDALVEELKGLPNIVYLELHLARHAWRWMRGLIDVCGLDELVLSSRPDPAFPERPTVGPTRWIDAVLASSVGDARVGMPAMSRPRIIAVSEAAIPCGPRSTLEDVERVSRLLLRTGVREGVRFVSREEESTVSIAQIPTFLRRRFDRSRARPNA